MKILWNHRFTLMPSRALLVALLLLLALGWFAETSQAAPRLKVSGNKRFLVYEDGKPFFWLGDTAWE